MDGVHFHYKNSSLWLLGVFNALDGVEPHQQISNGTLRLVP